MLVRRQRLGPILAILVAAFLFGATTSHVWADPAIHTVEAGDTLFSLAQRYQTSVEAIEQANGLRDASAIYRSQRLVIPAGKPDVAPYQPDSAADSLVDYVVQPGDTLIGIALRAGTTVRELIELNDLSQPVLMYAGQRLKLPNLSRSVDGTVLSPGLKRIEIDVSEQHMWVYEDDRLIWDWPASTGLPRYPTRYGRFQVLDKIPMAYSRPWDLWMPDWLGIYWAGSTENGIHSLPIINGQELWRGYLGSKISYGCIVVGTEEGKQLYDWADVGTAVLIRE